MEDAILKILGVVSASVGMLTFIFKVVRSVNREDRKSSYVIYRRDTSEQLEENEYHEAKSRAR